MNIGIWGAGIVGKATGQLFEKIHKVFYYDKYKNEENFCSKEELIKNCSVLFVSVPTPMKDTGEINLEHINDSIKEIRDGYSGSGLTPTVIIRSTVLPGTVDSLNNKYRSLNISYNPEFLRDRCALEDLKSSPVIVIGSKSERAILILKSLYNSVLENTNYKILVPREAEAVKYASNIMLAGLVSIANELQIIFDKLDIQYKNLEDILIQHPFIGKNIRVPGTDGDFGFGGKCLPKDLNAIIHLAKSLGYSPKLLEEIWNLNLKVRVNQNW